MKLGNKNICLTSPVTIMVIIALLFSTIVLANVWTESSKTEVVSQIVEDEPEDEIWIPTKEDILYQDSMYTIIRNTQHDVTNIKKDIVHILERLDYADGTHDSIRYVKGSKIDKKRN